MTTLDEHPSDAEIWEVSARVWAIARHCSGCEACARRLRAIIDELNEQFG